MQSLGMDYLNSRLMFGMVPGLESTRKLCNALGNPERSFKTIHIVGTNGKGLLLLSGGIDSPVAGWMMAKRGVKLEAVHFESFPYTSERALQKVLDLAKIVSDYLGGIYLHIISLTHIQEELVKHCNEEYFTLLLRRYMVALANKVAERYNCGALITGESVGQVASQTMQAIGVTDAVAEIPVFRPCIGMDKEEILHYFYDVDTYELAKKEWKVKFEPQRMKGVKFDFDLVNAETGKVVLEAGKKLTSRNAQKLADEGLAYYRLAKDKVLGKFLANNVVVAKTGEVLAEAGDEITEELLEKFGSNKINEIFQTFTII